MARIQWTKEQEELRQRILGDMKQEESNELDRLRAENAALVAANRGLEKELKEYIEGKFADVVAERDDLLEQLKVLYERKEKIVAERNKLAAFKAWVHAWLDGNGVPKEFPDGPHTKEGCRIGDRMEYLVVERDRLQDERDRLRAALEWAVKKDMCIYFARCALAGADLRDQEVAEAVRQGTWRKDA